MAGLTTMVAFRVDDDLLEPARLAAVAERVILSRLIRESLARRTAEVSARACRRKPREQ